MEIRYVSSYIYFYEFIVTLIICKLFTRTEEFSLDTNTQNFPASIYLNIANYAFFTLYPDVSLSINVIEDLKKFIESHISEYSEAYKDKLLLNLKQLFSFLSLTLKEDDEKTVSDREEYIFRVLMRVFQDGSNHIIKKYAEIFPDLLKYERNWCKDIKLKFENLFTKLAYLEFISNKIRDDTKNQQIWIDLFRCIFQQFYFDRNYLHTLMKNFMIEGGKIQILLLFESSIWRSYLSYKWIAPRFQNTDLEILISLIDESENIKAFLIDVIFLQINS